MVVCMLVHGGVHGGAWWCMVVHGGQWWAVVGSGGQWWSVVVLWWFCGGAWWCMVVVIGGERWW